MPWRRATEPEKESSTSGPPSRDGIQYREIGEGIVSGVKEAIPAARETVKGLLTGFLPSAKQAVTDPGRAVRNVVAGLASGASGLLHAPENIVKYGKEKGVLPEWVKPASVDRFLPKKYDYRKAIGLEDTQKGDELIYGLSQFAPNLVAGPLAPSAWAIGQEENPVTAQLIPKILGAPTKAIKFIAKKTRPSKMVLKYINKEISLDELESNLRAAEGTETSLGNIIKNPRMKKFYENQLANSPDVAVHETYERVAKQISEKAEKILKLKLGFKNDKGDGESDMDPNPFLKDILKGAKKKHETIKTNLYHTVNKMASNEGLQLELPKFENIIAENISAINESPLLKTDADFRRIFGRLSRIETKKDIKSVILDPQGRPVVGKTLRPSIRDAKVIANSFYSEGNSILEGAFSSAADRGLGRLYLKLANALRDDVQATINRGSKEIQREFNTAEKYYANDFSRFLDKGIYKMLGDEKGAETFINDIIKPGAKLDRHELISKVQDILPDNQKNLLGYSYLLKSIDDAGVIHPTKMRTLIKQLGPRQFKALFPELQVRQALMDFTKVVDMNAEVFSYLVNPKTGARNTAIISDLLKSAAYLTGGTLGGLAGKSTGVEPLATLGAFLGIYGTSKLKGASAIYLEKLLTNEEFRKKVVDGFTKSAKGGRKLKTIPSSVIVGKIETEEKEKK